MSDRPTTEPTLDQLWESFASDVDGIGWRQAVAFWRHPIEQMVRAEAAQGAAPLRAEIERRLDLLIEQYGDDHLAHISHANLAEWLAEYPTPLGAVPRAEGPQDARCDCSGWMVDCSCDFIPDAAPRAEGLDSDGQ